ncbi:MAG: DUF2185 domain-containing protein [Saccharospirillaceae bacterium]|nr:DUF2185 domain-containing protein [Pseudomonadales bacterium]NRB79543.1 DUF2185 domain-containing protein [Saccharospirillaceae bacterium]
MNIHNAHLCLVSTLIVNDRPMPIRFFYKESPNHQNDSGFRFYSGLESDDFLQTDEAACVAPLDCMIRVDPTIQSLIELSNIGSVWERLPNSNTWSEVLDYQIPA